MKDDNKVYLKNEVRDVIAYVDTDKLLDNTDMSYIAWFALIALAFTHIDDQTADD